MENLNSEITPVNMEGLDCIDNTVLTVCNYFRGEYEKVLWDSWSIRYVPDFVIGKGLKVCPKRIQDHVRKIYGIDFMPQGNLGKHEIKSKISQYIQEDQLLVAGIKTNSIPWQKSYNQNDYRVHFLIFTGMGEEGIWCVDTMPSKSNVMIQWNDVQRGLLSLIRVKVKPIVGSKAPKMKKVYKNVRYKVHCKDIESLRKKIREDFEVQREFGDQKNIWRIPLYNLFYIILGRHIQFEKYLTKECGIKYALLADQMRDLIVEWEALKILTVKMHREYTTSRLTPSKVRSYQDIYAENLEKIQRMEKSAKECFEKIYKEQEGDRYAGANSYQEDPVQEIFLDLPYNEYTHMLHPEDFYVDKVLEYGRIWEAEQCRFSLKEVGPDEYNCLKCEGQVLPVKKKIKGIYLLLYATYGSQLAELEIGYEEEVVREKIAVSDWVERPLSRETVIWQAAFRNKTPGGLNHTGKLVCTKVEGASQSQCSYVKLPGCKDIHILAVTVLS